MTSVGREARDAVEVAQSQHGQSITSGSSSTLDQGADLRRNVQTEQNKGVVRRLSAKGPQEVRAIGEDALELGKKMWNGAGESQQK